jgi:adhesin transport system membrane fusion protein
MNRLILWVCVLAVGAFVYWADQAEISQVIRASGQVIASGRSQIIQSADGGVLEQLLVKEGQVVVKGETLATLDRTRMQASFLESQAKTVALMGQVARLRSELNGSELLFPKELDSYPIFKREQLELYKKRKFNINQEISSLGRMESLARRELQMNEPLLKTGDISEVEIIRLRRQVMDIEFQISNKRNKYLQDTQAELAKAEEDLASVKQQSAQRLDSLQRTDLIAPVDGVVKNVRLTTLGAVVKPSEEVMQIVPTDGDLIIEVRVKPQDVGRLKTGLAANIKVDAYDYTIYGSLSGTLSYLSPDTLSEDIKPNEQPYYRAQIKVLGKQFSSRPNEPIDIQPGMTATAEIVTGRHTILNYLIKPMIKTVSESLQER